MFIRPHPYTCLGIECRDEVHASPITDRVQLRLRAAVQVADEGADVAARTVVRLRRPGRYGLEKNARMNMFYRHSNKGMV
jgi:hypothetical protein